MASHNPLSGLPSIVSVAISGEKKRKELPEHTAHSGSFGNNSTFTSNPFKIPEIRFWILMIEVGLRDKV